MRTADLMEAWKKILRGEQPSLSVEITKECPLRCPGCYAYDAAHLGGSATLRGLSDRRGRALVEGVLELADRLRPLHISLVGGEPLVRYREVEELAPALIERGMHVQLVTSGIRPLAPAWSGLARMTTVVSIDGLRREHDRRRAPATYGRILANIAGQRVTVHCTITAQMMERSGYLREFVEFWTAQPEVERVWFSLFTPQVGEISAEVLSAEQRARAVAEMLVLRREFRKLDMREGLIRQFERPPRSPEECVFAMTTRTVSADLETEVRPCQFGGRPDCARCGCVAAMGLAAVAAHKVGGVVPVGAIFRASVAVGRWRRGD